MPEPMSSNEIEDVLSSIRRLVTQDLKPADRARLAAVATQKLVLAPENRVEEPPAQFATVRRASRRAAFPPVDAVLAGVAALAGRDRDDDAPVQSADWSLGAAADKGFVEPAPPPRPPADPFPPQPQMRQDAVVPPQPQMRPDWPPAGHVMAPAPDDADDIVMLPPGYGPDDAPATRDEFAIDPNARLFDTAAKAFATDPVPEWQDEEPEEMAQLPDSVDSAVSTPEQAQSLQGTIEPDSDWADAAERIVIAELSGEAAPEEAYVEVKDTFREPKFTAAPAQAAAEVLFDEDMLRAMVQAILREEMAGPMGERITRNIRKLVRAEVGRMLAAHELE